jgi:site-specific recombinase XerD
MKRITFEQAIKIINQYYQNNGYKSANNYFFDWALLQIEKFSSSCIDNFNDSLIWLNEIENKYTQQQFNIIRNTIYLVNDVIGEGKVSKTTFIYSNSPCYQKLNLSFRTSLDKYLKILLEIQKLNKKTIKMYRLYCSRIMISLQERGIDSPVKITFKVLEFYCKPEVFTINKDGTKKNKVVNAFENYISFLEKDLNLPYSLHIMLKPSYVQELFFIEDLEENQHHKFIEFTNQSNTNKEFYLLKNKYLTTINSTNYSKTQKSVAKRFLTIFQLFIEANELVFSIELFELWFSIFIEKAPRGQKKAYNRIRYLFLRLYQTGSLDFKVPNSHTCKYIVSSYWNNLINEYIEERLEEEVKESSLLTDHSSISRFVVYLDSVNIFKPSQITSQVIIDFQIQSEHSTPRGKQAFSYVLRNFIRFLARKKLVPNTLEFAVTTNCAPSTTIVKILDEDQKRIIYEFVEKCSTPMEYRIAAMTMLALHLGLRKSDICNLKFSNVNFNTSSISIIQQKTNSPLKLSMPNIVSNCLFLYITKGRPIQAIDSNFVFVKHFMPYTKVNHLMLGRQLNKIFECNGCNPINGIHTLRRDFGSTQLKNNINLKVISSTLGHTCLDSIKPYLSLDEQRMRECPITLDGIEIKEGLYE